MLTRHQETCVRIQHEGEADVILKDVETRLYDIRFNLWRLVALELKDEVNFSFYIKPVRAK